MFRTLLISSLLSGCCYTPVSAQVTLDGSLGKSGALSGPNYQIGANLGQQHGGNLFHSFRDFNLHSHESATFSGPANVQNVISRVTGGNPSSIDGTLRSTIPNANLYFLNPFGILYGPNAKLDVPGSFHASTADYLRLNDGGRFDAHVPSNSLLTVAPPEAFGFLTNTPAAITAQDSHLSVPEGQTLSLIGGDLRLTGSHPYTLSPDGTQLQFDAELLAPGGRINLASVAAQGKVIPTDTGLSLSQVAQRGTILAQNALINASGSRRGGSVFIRSGQFELTGSAVGSQTNGDQNGSPIDIQVDKLKLLQGSQISSGTYGMGNAGSVVIKADTVEAAGHDESGGASIINSDSSTENSGNAGAVEITARQLTLADGAIISSDTHGTGQGGAITLKVADNLTLTGSYISAGSFGTMPQAGKAGNLTIQASQLTLTAGGYINSSAYGTGQGGSITLRVIDTLTVSGQYAGQASQISSIHANQVHANQLHLTRDGGNISTEVFLGAFSRSDLTSQLCKLCGGPKTLEEIMNPRFKFYVYPIAGSRQSVADWGPSPVPMNLSAKAQTGKSTAPSARSKKTDPAAAKSEYQRVLLLVECPQEEKAKAGIGKREVIPEQLF